jgi:hypothetical protein
MRQVLWLFPLVLLLVVGFTSPTFADPDDLDVIVIFKKGTDAGRRDDIIRQSSDGGIVRPSAFAVLRSIASSNFVGCSMGRSPALAPLRMRSTKVAARRHCSNTFPLMTRGRSRRAWRRCRA